MHSELTGLLYTSLKNVKTFPKLFISVSLFQNSNPEVNFIGILLTSVVGQGVFHKVNGPSYVKSEQGGKVLSAVKREISGVFCRE